MAINIKEDILSITELKKNTHKILKQIHNTHRPVVLTVNGKAEAVLVDAIQYEKMVQAFNMAKMLKPAEEDVKEGRTRSARKFFKEFKNAKEI